MLQYAPEYFDWLLITSAGPLAIILYLVGFALILWMVMLLRREKSSGIEFLKLGLPGVFLIAAGFFIPSFVSTGDLSQRVAAEIAETANFTEVKLTHVATTSDTPITEGSVSFIGIATDLDGDPRQFVYTQYADFGIYEAVGFGKPPVDLRDDTLVPFQDGLNITVEPTATSSATPEATPSATPVATESANFAPTETATPTPTS